MLATTPQPLIERCKALAPSTVSFWSVRHVSARDESISVRQNIVQPVMSSDDTGIMITVIDHGGMGYAATCDLSDAGIQKAFTQAREWAKRTAGRTVANFEKIRVAPPRGEYTSPVRRQWNSVTLGDKIERLRGLCSRLKRGDEIVDWDSSLWQAEYDTHTITSDGGNVVQRFTFIVPMLTATANKGSVTVTRTLNSRGYCRQAGLEMLDQIGFDHAPEKIGDEARQLLAAPTCPSGTMDVVLDPGQMVLQIHESIGHPLELDRILGDERNYAGTSFVTPDMFGRYQYGSPLLNVTFDPTIPDEFSTYRFDEEGAAAQRVFLIKDGILLRGIGSVTSQFRLGVQGTATARCTSWNRPPIDRMANLNLEPGRSTLDELIGAVKSGIFMKTNCSWSIDDSRNKFQFGCEWGQLIENGKLTKIVRKPNYRGISATFWRSLKMVGDRSTFEVLGTPFCGKGEPNQIIKVGHATPACLFTNVDVFGGE